MDDSWFANLPGEPPATPEKRNDNDDGTATMSPTLRALAEFAFDRDIKVVRKHYLQAFLKGHDAGYGRGYFDGLRARGSQVPVTVEVDDRADGVDETTSLCVSIDLPQASLTTLNEDSSPAWPEALANETSCQSNKSSAFSSPTFVSQWRPLSDPFKPQPALVPAPPFPNLFLSRLCPARGPSDPSAPSPRLPESKTEDAKWPNIMDEPLPSPQPGAFCTPPLVPQPPTPVLAPVAPATLPGSPVRVPAAAVPGTTTLYGIPPASAVRPVEPDFERTLRRRRESPPPYPDMDCRGRLVENPWRLLVGPISEAARADWWRDKGKQYFRQKVDGVVLCQLVEDAAGRGYVAILFESEALAGRAKEVFTGYACGGSIMWSWIYREVE